MRHKRLKLSALFLLGMGLTSLQAQESVNATGNNASGSGGSVSYSIGQAVYQIHSGTSGSVAEGVQQPYEISQIDGIREAKDIILQCSAFPNPTDNYLILRIENYALENLYFRFLDLNGKLLDSDKLKNRETIFQMAHIPSGTYILKIIDAFKDIKTFQIIINH